MRGKHRMMSTAPCGLASPGEWAVLATGWWTAATMLSMRPHPSDLLVSYHAQLSICAAPHAPTLADLGAPGLHAGRFRACSLRADLWYVCVCVCLCVSV